MDADPRSQVEAPVRGALEGVMGRGLALVGLMALLALWPVIARPDEHVRDAFAGIALGVLVIYGLSAYGGPEVKESPLSETKANVDTLARLALTN